MLEGNGMQPCTPLALRVSDEAAHRGIMTVEVARAAQQGPPPIPPGGSAHERHGRLQGGMDVLQDQCAVRGIRTSGATECRCDQGKPPRVAST